MSKLRPLYAPRRTTLGALLLTVLPAALLGCGAPPAPASPASSLPSAAPVVVEEAPDLAPVAAPAELVALARFAKPQTALETVGAWANFPFKLHDLLPAEFKGLEGVVAWDAPLEAAVALDPTGEGRVPEPLAVVSLGLTSLDGALDFVRGKGQSVRRLRAGVYRVGDSDQVSCAIGVARGSAPARLVCGQRARDVDGLFNYATRGMPSEPLPSVDFQVELRLAPIKAKYGSEIGSARLFAGFLLRRLQLDNARFDRALSDVAYGLVDEGTALVHDLDRLRLDANLDAGKSMVDLRLNVKFVGQKSWLVQSSTEMIPLAAPAPELFWQMPADSTGAGFSVGLQPGRLKPLGHSLADLLDAYLESEKVPAKLRDQVSKTVESVFNQNTKQVRAQGELSRVPADPLLAAGYRAFGWQIAAVDGDTKSLLALFDGLSGILANRDFSRLLKQRLEVDTPLLPKITATATQLRGYKPGAKAYRIDIPRDLFLKYAKRGMDALPAPAEKGKPLAKTVTVTLIVASDGERSWVGFSPDAQVVRQRLESLKDANSPVLRGRAGLEPLQSAPHVGGGFLTLARFAAQLSSMARANAETSTWLAGLPHHGETPILFSYDLSSVGPEFVSRLSVPRSVVEDLGALVPVIAMMAGKP